ncbi:ankyrin repeat domain-containing protein 10-like, partial [Scleropages formosus]
CSLRNASGLTAADLAHTQGFQECAQLLSNVQNQLNEFCPNGAPNGHHPQTRAPSLFNGAPNRKRSLECMESGHIKKARSDGPDSPMKIFGSVGEELESMHMESSAAFSSGGPGAFLFDPSRPESTQDHATMESASAPRELEIFTVASMQIPCRCTNSYAYLNGHMPEKTLVTNGFSANGSCPQPHLNGEQALLANGFSGSWGVMASHTAENGSPTRFPEQGLGAGVSSTPADMCGSLHLGDSPSGCVSQRPLEHTDPRDSLHYGHYHGFGDTAENIEEVSSQVEHVTSIKAEQRYKHTVLSTMHLYHGS